MSCDLLPKWLNHYDPVHRGWTPVGIAHGVCATHGFFFPRIRGGYILRRCRDGSSAPVDEIVGSTGADAEMVHTFPWVVHEAGGTYMYRLSAINGGGCASESPAVAIVGFDVSGAWVGNKPNAPADLRVTALAGGRFRLAWTSNDNDQPVAPAHFHVYHDGGSGVIDYGTIAGVVAYVPGRFHFHYDSDAFAHGTRVRWAVRAVNADGLEDHNTHWALAVANAHVPALNLSVHVRCEDVMP